MTAVGFGGVFFRAKDPAALGACLARAGVTVCEQYRNTGYGDFARIDDPEGNPIERWQPPARPAT